MKVTLQRSFPLPAPADQAWGLLKDVTRVASCMPGAALTERIDERHYKGTVAVRFGPANMSFRGELEVLAIEPATRTLRLIGKGTDAGGGSGAALDLTARVDPVNGASSQLSGSGEMSLSGRVAAFGARLADSVAQQVLQQFAANFIAELNARTTSAAAGGDASAGDTSGGAPQASPARARPLSGLALLWGMIVSWLRGLTGTRGA